MIRLERNYRSTGHILAVAAGLIAQNKNRLGKTLYTDRESGRAADRARRAGQFGGSSRHRRRNRGRPARGRFAGRYGDPGARLVSDARIRGALSRDRHALSRHRRPRFYERAEIRDALAYFRCAFQPDDDLAFERIYNLPRRGLGEATLSLLHAHGRGAGVSLMRAAQQMVESEELKSRPRQILRDLAERFRALVRARSTS